MEETLERSMHVLAAAALRLELSWQEVDANLRILERYQHLAADTYWSIYERLGEAA